MKLLRIFTEKMLTRLQTFTAETLISGKLKQPNGHLQPDQRPFWSLGLQDPYADEACIGRC
ncbi:hypothetical protein XM38_018160 [Halomicronema hongdechloris C2206]|uniref:Uncharacterized protein n=1 Tax=Halomicronema hongdechloris C2206 TaxID=1641165 RepID=A0A1Z3HKP5_9CYAN|nr:hypothetical protein XM38_018160 [Halomicronema hongdechloris C2206]